MPQNRVISVKNICKTEGFYEKLNKMKVKWIVKQIARWKAYSEDKKALERVKKFGKKLRIIL